MTQCKLPCCTVSSDAQSAACQLHCTLCPSTLHLLESPGIEPEFENGRGNVTCPAAPAARSNKKFRWSSGTNPPSHRSIRKRNRDTEISKTFYIQASSTE